MSSQDFLRNNLLPEETLLWKKEIGRNYLNEILKNIIYLIGIILLALIPILIYFTPILIPTNFLLILIIVIITAIISIVPSMFLVESIKTYFKLKNNLNFNLKTYRNYEEFVILTNKRWIQKSLSYEKYQYSEYSSAKITFDMDIASIILDDISVIYITPHRKLSKLTIMLFIEWEEDLPYKDVFWVDVEPNDWKRLKANFQSVITFSTKKINEFREGDIVLYCKHMVKK